MGRLLKLEVENFKSYYGKQIIGPFDEDFVSIIGPNGAGKSNLMDAVSFVLGIHSGHLRSSQLTDLIYRRGSEDNSRSKKGLPSFANVAAYYIKNDGTQLVFSRRVNSNGHSEYRLNDRVITYANYVKIWEEENVLIKARNFLVFQGDVEAIASKSPKELSRLFEQISGSDEFREEYERCKAVVERIQEETSANFNMKKAMGAELRLVEEQKQDVIKFEKVQNALRSLQAEYYLWKLFHLEDAARKLGSKIEEKEELVKSSEKTMRLAETEWKEAKKKQAKTQKDILSVEKKFKAEQKKIGENAPAEVQLEEKIKFSNQRILATEENYNSIEVELNNINKDLEIGLREISEVEKQSLSYEKQSEQILNASEVSQELLLEYNDLKSKVCDITAKDRLKLESLERKLAPELATKKQLESKYKELEMAKARLEDEKEAHLRKQEELRTNQERITEEISTVQREIASSQASKLKLQQTEVEITEKLRDIMSKLLQVKVDKQESEKEIKLRATLESLKRIFPGIHGRMIDLCKPTNKKYEQAISIALGRNIDAIVVEHEKTAIECIKYLRENRSGQATFIPLDTINNSNTNYDRFRGLADGCRPILDVIKFENIYERAFQYACGSAIICDTMVIARQICFERDIRVKAITLEGSIIHKSGLMTGGASNQSSRRWEEREVQQLQQERDQCIATLAEINKNLKRTGLEEKLKNQLLELGTRQAFISEELAAQRRKIQGIEEELLYIDQEWHKCINQLETVGKSLSKHDKDIENWGSAIARVEDSYFADFCEKVKFDNIREFERSRSSITQEISEKKLQFSSVLTKLYHQVDFLRHQQTQIQNCKLECQRLIENLKSDLSVQEGEKLKLLSVVDQKRVALQEVQNELNNYKKIFKEDEAQVNIKRVLLTEAQNNLSQIYKEIGSSEAEIDRLLNNRKNLLKSCKIDEIELPLSNGMPFRDVDIEIDQSEHPILFNYSSLPRQSKNSNDMVIEHKYQDRIKSYEDDLEKLSPNLRALDKLESAESRLQANLESFNKTKQDLFKAKSEFDSVRKKRLERFNTAFKVISSKIDAIYKELTRSELVPVGGSANLYLDNVDEPYSEGIRFSAMPPLKRHLEMDQLSGGEKTVAALALLFAIHSFRPAPFFILDEIDAALDSGNVQRVASFIHARSTGIPLINNSIIGSSQNSPSSPISEPVSKVQFLVISLKSSFYAKAGALVGIYRDVEGMSSRVLSLRLSDYPE